MWLQRIERDEAAADASPRGDRGFSLVEVLVAIVLISTSVIPLLLASIVSIRVSGQTHTVSKVETVLANAADRVNRAGESCDYAVYVQAAALAEGWNADRATVAYQYYVPAVNSPTVEGTWADGACPSGTRTAGLVQKVTIKVKSPDNRVQRTIVVVKSDV